jgi:hypothetical protein
VLSSLATALARAIGDREVSSAEVVVAYGVVDAYAE